MTYSNGTVMDKKPIGPYLNEAQIHILAYLFTGTSIFLTIGRLVIRWRKVHRWTLEDILNSIAAILLVPFIATCMLNIPTELQLQSHLLGMDAEMPTMEAMAAVNRVELALLLLFWVTIYTVKASFLALYWRLFSISRKFRLWWYFIAAFTLLSFGITIPSIFWRCGDPSKILDIHKCSDVDVPTAVTIVVMWCCLNVVGGILLMLLPILMVSSRMLTLEKPQRFGIMFVFGLVFVDIAFDVIRTVYSLSPELSLRSNLMAVWTIAEPNIAVIVCALPHYKGLVSCGRRKSSSFESRPTYTTSSKSIGPTAVPMELQDVSGYSLDSRSQMSSV